MLAVKQFVFNNFAESTYVVYDEATLEAIVVDPGMATAAERQRFDDFIKDKQLKLTGIVNTHLHVDHGIADGYVRDKYGVPVKAHIADAPLGARATQQALMFGLDIKVNDITIDAPLKAGDYIQLGDSRLEVIHVPGHSPGGIALYSPDGHFAIVGDSLFKSSVGRTDLPGGDTATLINAVKNNLLTLPDDTLVLSGHGPSTTIGAERRTNPFLR